MAYLRATAAVALAAAAAVYVAACAGVSAQEVAAEPFARIERVIVAGARKDNPSSAELKVVRGAALVPPGPSLSLFEDDEIITGANVSVTLIMLEAAAEQGNTVLVGPGTQIRLRGRRSVFLIIGRLLADVRGLFDVVTSRATLGAKGTEFEVRVTESDTRLVVLEGAVAVTEETGGRAAGPGARALEVLHPFWRTPPASHPRTRLPALRIARDAGQRAQPPHERWVVEIDASAPVKTTQQITITNRCQQPHVYDVEGPGGLPWFNLFVPERVEVAPGVSRAVTVNVHIDPAAVTGDSYSGDAAIKCLDCFTEPGCTQARDLLPVQIKLARSAQLTVRALEELTIANADVPVAPRRASEDVVRTTINWTSDVILAGQPTYSARRVMPNFETPEARARAFREARLAALWRQEPGAFERLGEVYVDWGAGAKALESFTHEAAVTPERMRASGFLADMAEAHRLKGHVDLAEQQVRAALEAEPRNAAALNTLGNVYMDRAAIAMDGDQPGAVEGLIVRARNTYQRVAEAAPADPTARAVAVANVGETHVEMGNRAVRTQQLDEARVHYQAADRTFKEARSVSPRYAFSRVGWGDAFQGMGVVAEAQGQTAVAREDFSRAAAQYRSGLEEHPALAEAHIGVGDLLLREGRQREALESYARAVAARPSEPAAYYRLGTLLERENPLLAARYLDTFLKLQPAAFKTGRSARRAVQVVDAIRPVPGTVNVPNLVSLDERAAREALARAQLNIGTITPRASPSQAGTVIDQDPKAGVRAAPGSAVNIVVAGVERGGAPPPPGPSLVPDVSNLTLAEATRAIEAAGFTVGRVERKNSTRPPGTITKQDPSPRRAARPGTAVALEVAQREVRTVKVPDIVGDTRDHAIEDIKDEKLQVGVIREQPACATGRVVAQNPPENTRVPEGTAVSFTVSVPGPQAVIVPQVAGLPQARAEALLRERGLRAGRTTRVETDRQEAGTVMKQEPRASVPIAPGCPVDLEVAAPIPLVSVPNFVGLTEEQARQRLPGGLAGVFSELRLGEVTYRDAASDAALATRMTRARAAVSAPTVIEQAPQAGSQVRKGSTVSLVVYRPAARDTPSGVTVPSLKGLTLAEARSALANVNLALGDVSYNPRATARPSNRIMAQDPAAGAVVARGTRIRVQIDGKGD